MYINLVKNIFKIVYKQTGIQLLLIQQNEIKKNAERQVGYICKDINDKKYWLTIAFSELQKYRLQETIENITKNSNMFSKYFDFNYPICYGTCNNTIFILYEYIDDFTKDNYYEVANYERILHTIYDKESYILKLDNDKIEKIILDIAKERCPDNENSRNIFLNDENVMKYKQLLSKFDEIRMVRTHCDFKPNNIIASKNKRYLIGFEFGGIDLPIGFDLYCLKRNSIEKNYDNVPYKDLHEVFCKFHHVGTNISWLSYGEPRVKLIKNKSFIKVLEDGAYKTLYIKQKIPYYKFDLEIDFSNVKISPIAVSKLVKLIQKKYDEKYIVRFKNCPYYFDRLEQDGINLLSFSGVINKDYQEPKNFIEYIKGTQAYINYSRMLPYIKPYWFRALMAMLVCIPIGSLDAVIALSLKPYMDLVMVEKSVQSPWYIPLGIVAFTCVQGGLNYFATYMNTWVGGRITNDLKYEMFKKMLTFEAAYFDKKKSGDVVFRFNNDVDIACSGLLENLKTFLSKIFSSISLVGVLFYNSWQLALIAVFVLVCAFTPLARIRKRVKSVMDQSVAAGSAAITAYNESFAGYKTITAYNLVEYQKNKFEYILKNIFSLKIKIIQRTSWLSPIMHIIVSIGIGIAIWYGSYLILTNQITSGNFVSFITALIMLYQPIKNIGNNFNSVQFSFLAIERIFSVIDTEPKIKNSEESIELVNISKRIRFENVNFEYVPNRPVLKNINLEVYKGETVAFVGNSGGGKTTIVNLLPRFYDIKSGSISIDGVDIRNYTLESLRQNIAVVFQDNFLFSGTIKENILLGKENATEEEIQKALKMAYLDEFVSTLKDGINTQIGERGILLSGGQKQRVAIARAFLKDAPIIILDEATSALDNKAEAIVQKAIDNLMQDKTVFVIAHRLSTIQNANKIVVINQGEIVENGTHEELLKIDGGAYKSLYEMQFKKQEAKV